MNALHNQGEIEARFGILRSQIKRQHYDQEKMNMISSCNSVIFFGPNICNLRN